MPRNDDTGMPPEDRHRESEREQEEDSPGDGLPGVIVVVEEGRSRRRRTSNLTRLRKRLRGGRRAQREEFAQIMEAARQAAAEDPLSLPSLIRLFGRAAQARAFTEVLRHAQDRGDCNFDPEDVMFSLYEPLAPDGRRFVDLRREVEAPGPMRLGVDILLPWPWSREGLIRSLSKLRPGGEWGTWRQDRNHCVELWLPIGVGWVIGGNHSITAGILNCEGEVMPEVTYDISAAYEHITCDGLDYQRAHDGSRIAPVADLDVAAMFEIGRLMCFLNKATRTSLLSDLPL